MTIAEDIAALERVAGMVENTQPVWGGQLRRVVEAAKTSVTEELLTSAVPMRSLKAEEESMRRSATYKIHPDLPAETMTDAEAAAWFRWWLPHAAEETGLNQKRIMEGLISCRFADTKPVSPRGA